MDVLVETHDEEEIERANALGASMIGINNRDLRTFVTDLAVTERLASKIPSTALIVTESGIRHPPTRPASRGPAPRPCWWARA